MSTVYRIQSKQNRNRGAYRSHIRFDNEPDAVKRLLKEHNSWDDPKHPPPSKDIGIVREIEIDEHCGFDSAAALLRWFRGFIPDLLRAGYEIVALHNIKITSVGVCQVLFTWED